MKYVNTNCFRVNANGNKIDVWLIYQCEKCKHTYNMSIYERKKLSGIQPEIYKSFLDNDTELALKFGTDKQFFANNRAEIDWSSIEYNLHVIPGGSSEEFDCIEIYNPYKIKIRTDKVVADLLHLTRNKIKMLLKNDVIEFSQNYLGHMTRILIKDITFYQL